MYNVQTGSRIQHYLILSKIIPIGTVILTGLFLMMGSVPVDTIVFTPSLTDFGSTIPLVLFSLLGFEAVCSLSRQIEHPEKNASYAVLISYLAVLFIYIAYQALFYSSLATQFLSMNDFKDAFPALFTTLAMPEQTVYLLSSCVYLLIGTSALSGAYGIFFANQWNLYSLVQQKSFWGCWQIDTLNKNQVPYVCIIVEALICALYLNITNGQQIVLQQLAALGTTVTYAFCVVGLLYTTQKRYFVGISYAGMVSCLVLIGACVRNFFYNGLNTFFLYTVIMTIGICLFVIQMIGQKSQHKQSSTTP
jgi:amino acid transporter